MSDLWKKILSDPAARAFIKKHPEFAAKNYQGATVAFFQEYVEGAPFIAEVIQQEGPYNSELQAVADLIFTTPLHLVARKLRWPRDKVYNRVRQLKHVAIKRWKQRRNELLNSRNPHIELDTHPQHICVASREFTHAGKTAIIYCISRDGCLFWVDEHGKAFTPEIQDILCNLEADEFEVLDVD